MLKSLYENDRITAKRSKEILNIIKRHNTVTRSQIIDRTGFTMSTLVRIMNQLEANGLIQVTQTLDTAMGRKPALYSIHPEAGYIIGVEISRTFSRIALMNAAMDILKSHTFGMYSNITPEIAMDRIIEWINNYTKEVSKDKLLGIGVGAVGPIDREKGIMMNPVSFSATGWENISIKNILEQKTGLPTWVEDGVDLGAVAEFQKGCGVGMEHLVYVICGVGLRLGMIINGKLYIPHRGRNETFGHMTVKLDGHECSCGKKGCIESYVSFTAILDEFISEIKHGKSSVILEKIDFDLSSLTFDMFCEAAAMDDPLANKIIQRTASYLAAGLINVNNLLRPDIIVVGGVLIRKCRKLFDLACNIFEFEIGRNNILSMGCFGEDAVMAGAGSMVLDHYLK